MELTLPLEKMAFLSLILHPIPLVIFEVIITTLAISFTRPSSVIRLILLPLLIAATWLITTSCPQRIPHISFASVVAGNGPTYLVRYIDLVLLSRWSYDTKAPTRSPSAPRNRDLDEQKNAISRVDGNENQPPATGSDRLRFGIHLTLASRHLNTPWQVKNVPHFSASDPRYIPSRGIFLRGNAIAVLLYCFVLDISSFGVNPETNSVLFASQRIPFFARLSHVSSEEIAIRIISSLTLWLNIYCVASMGYRILGIIAVGTGVSPVSAWRPPFGELADAYTVRRFWG
jgi:hypothetical protein